jgi:excisionase family DNA binding protein
MMHTQTQPQARKLSVGQAAEELGISPHTVRAWVRERKIEFFRIGRRILIDEKAISALLEDARVEPIAR